MQLYLDGDYDHIKLENWYKLPFETCLMFLLYRLSAPRRILECIRKPFKNGNLQN
jgi:hypothetical protein